MHYVDEIVKSNYARLELLWIEKLRADNIVKQTEHGDVLVGDQAEAGRADHGRDSNGVRAESQAAAKA